ncbi:inositol-3-phosphate synthase, partial [Streptomyces parvulus]|uniref:inositol-3-phosphate synthase n=1 Tax=Streptomyces parvulus TaxID=146923 RepID=UPI0036A02894
MATTTVVGAAALRAGLVPATGCVSTLEAFDGVPLPGFDDLVFGGHDVVATSLGKRAEQLADAGVVPRGLPGVLTAELNAADAEIRPAPPGTQSGDQAAAAEALVADLTGFRERLGLGRVVVVNVSSVQPPAAPHPAHASTAALREALARGERPLPVSSLYAYAALGGGWGFFCFPPSEGGGPDLLGKTPPGGGISFSGRGGKKTGDLV